MRGLSDRALVGLRAFALAPGPGEVVADRFELGRRLGEGGMGVVFAAHDRETGREVAVKIVEPGASGDDDEARFAREVGALAKVAHPAIVPYVAHGMHEGARYLVMERLEGCSLAERLVLGKVGFGEAAALGHRVAEALAAVHEAGVVHRDVKPANIFLASAVAREPRLLDFGIARIRDATTLTATGALVGTPGYMAPEQIRAGAEVGPPADVFALGAVLYEAVTGRRAFEASEPEKLFAAVLAFEPERIAKVREGTPPALDVLVARMLAKDPAARPSARECAEALAALENDVPGEDVAPSYGVAPGALLAGRYRVEGTLGQGGMGIVLAAKHVELGSPVAIKLLRSHVTDASRFLREARAASRLESEHVVRVLDVGRTEDGAPFLVMERLRGEDLAARLAAHGPFDVPTAARWALEACEGIAEAHALGIVHRDLKPSNLFLAARKDGTERVKVLDFGISKITRPLDEDASSVTETGGAQVLGSIAYMSPEQLAAPSRVDARTDVWSVGVLLHELVSGERPFQGEGPAALGARIAASEPPSLDTLGKDLPPGFADTVLRCLAKDPARRFPDAFALARALAPFAGEPGRASLGRIAQLAGTPPPLPVSSTPAPAPPRAKPARWPLLLAATAGAASLAAFVAFRGDPPVSAAPIADVDAGAVSPVMPASPSASALPPPTASAPTPSIASASARPKPAPTPAPSRSSPPRAKPSAGALDLRDPALESR